jgi:hypothetical protein
MVDLPYFDKQKLRLGQVPTLLLQCPFLSPNQSQVKPIVKNGLIRGQRIQQDGKASDDNFFSETHLAEGE